MINPSSPILTLVGLGISILLLGGVLGGVISRKQQVKEEIKEIQKQQQEVLLRIEADRKQALENEQRALAQIDSVYQVLDVLAVREGKIRGNINDTRKNIERLRDQANKTQSELAKAAEKSVISFDNQ